MSEVSAARKGVLKNLGLDENDTTPRELYYALRHKASDTNKKFEEKLGINQEDSPEVVCQKMIKFVESLKIPNDVWAVKNPVVKRMLKKQPPKRLLKALGLRSIDSVLKRSQPGELLAMAYKSETPEWTKKMQQQLKSLSPTDFQTEKIHIFNADAAKAEKLRKTALKDSNIITSICESGTILITPPPKRFELDTLGLALLLVHELHQLRVHSSYLRHISVKNDFGARLYRAANSGLPGSIKDARIGWKQLHKHLNINPRSIGKIEQPYLQPEDIITSGPFELMEDSLADGKFWKDGSILFMKDNKNTASMHLMDVIINASNQFPYEKAANTYLKMYIWEDLGARYLQNSPIESDVISEIDESEL